MVMKKVYLLATIALAPILLGAQICVTLYEGDNFGLNDMESHINVLEFDSADNAWFGLRTDSVGYGLGKFENNEWIEVNNPDIIPNPMINAIAFDQNDSVWVATEGGLSVFHRLSYQGRIMNTSNSEIPEDFVTAVAVDQQNMIWAGFNSGAVARYNGMTWEVFQAWPNGPVNVIEVAMDNSIWVGLDGNPGIMIFNGETWLPAPGLNDIQAITADHLGRVLVCSHDSLLIFNGAGVNTVRAVSGLILQDVTVGPMGGIWASTSQGLLYRSGDEFIRYGNHNSAVPAVLSNPIEFNSQGQLWFGYTYAMGANNLSGTGFLYRTTDPEQAIVTSDRPGDVFCFGDSLTLTAEDGSPNYVWPDGMNDNSYVLYDAEVVQVAVERENKCYFYDTVTVNVQKVYAEEKVCAVSVDSSGNIMVIWESTAGMGTESFNIYRETIAGDWEMVGNIPMGSLSLFEDMTADPMVRSERYKITCVDTCGDESGKSFYHNTLHLSVSEGGLPTEVNLNWNAYEGVTYDEFIVYSGPDPDNMAEIARVPKDRTTYMVANVMDTAYFRIVIELPEQCDPTGNLKAGTGPYNHSLSNLDDNRKLLTHISGPESVMELTAYPNPFFEKTRIEFPNPGQTEYQLTVYNINGKKVREIGQIMEGEIILTRENLETGFYVFELRGEYTYRGKFVVK
jgi:hypothetical protein